MPMMLLDSRVRGNDTHDGLSTSDLTSEFKSGYQLSLVIRTTGNRCASGELPAKAGIQTCEAVVFVGNAFCIEKADFLTSTFDKDSIKPSKNG